MFITVNNGEENIYLNINSIKSVEKFNKYSRYNLTDGTSILSPILFDNAVNMIDHKLRDGAYK